MSSKYLHDPTAEKDNPAGQSPRTLRRHRHIRSKDHVQGRTSKSSEIVGKTTRSILLDACISVEKKARKAVFMGDVRGQGATPMNCATTSVEQCALLIGVRREDHITVDLTMLVKTLTSEGVILP